jgi:hypothetical protein
VMGAAVVDWDEPTRLNSASKLALGWEDPNATARLELDGGETSRTWSMHLAPMYQWGEPGQPRIIEVADPMTGERYAIEYREGRYPSWFYGMGYAMQVGPGAEDVVLYEEGVRILRQTADGGTSAFTVASPKAALLQSSAWYDAWSQGDEISNPSGSVRVRVIGGNGGSYADIEVTLARPDVSQAKPVYRFWSDRFQGHFYTISEAERAKVVATWPDVWSYEGPKYSAFATQVPGTVPLYRFWSERYRSHFFTTDAGERDRVNRLWPDVWADEGVAYYVYPLETDEPNTVRMARFWSPLNSHHFYTADPVERDRVIRTWPSPIWDYEGDAFRVPFTG